ncbi:MAG: condensation domain-containing protein, partial [Psychrosphaera sp.]|nr:condensation domain-containing protein [Psychrosphaera sp.]
SVTANFFELGGDSILSIQVVSRAAQAGLHFSVKDLFVAQTIQALALMVKSGVQVVAQQEPITGSMSLLPIQRLFFQDGVDVHHFNQSVMLNTPKGFDESCLISITEQLYQRHDALRMQFVEGQGHYLPLTKDLIDGAVEIKTLSDDDFGDIDTLASDIQRSLSLAEGRLMKVVYIQTHSDEPSEGRLLIVIHHLVVDGVSWRILLEDIENLYGHWQSQTVLKLPAKTSSYQQWGDYLAEYANTPALTQERDYWLAGFECPVYPLANLAVNEGTNEAASEGFAQVDFSLDKTLTEQLLTDSHRPYQTQINELLLAGLLLGIGRWGGGDSIRLDLESHGRDALTDRWDLSQTVGWFTSIYPLTLRYQGESLQDLICAVKESHRAIPHKGIGFGVLKYLKQDSAFASLANSELMFNYLGQFDQVINDSTYFGSATESTGEEMSPNRTPTHGLAMNGMVAGGQLGFTLSFDQAKYHKVAMQALMDTIAVALADIVQHCLTTEQRYYTPSDFGLAKVSQSELNEWQLDKAQGIEDLYPASGMQQGLLFHSMLLSGSYVTQMLLLFSQLDVDIFKQAWQQVVQRHSIFRTAFVGLAQGNAHQLVYCDVELPWLELDLSQLNKSSQQAKVADIQHQDKVKDFIPSKAPLMRMTLIDLGDDEHQLLWSHHHALLDGWCLRMVFGEVTECYRAAKIAQPAKLATVLPYRHYAAWLGEQNQAQAVTYWQTLLADIEAPTPLPLLNNHDNEAKDAQTEVLEFSEAQTQTLVNLAQSTQTTVNVILQAAWGLLLSRFSAQQQVVFGAVTSGRPGDLTGAEDMIGLFINSLPVVLTIDDQASVASYLLTGHRQMVVGEGA